MAKEEINQIKDGIDKACRKVVLQEEILKLKQQCEQQLTQAKQQLIFWDTRVKQLTGSLANCDAILAKSQKVKTLELESDNTRPKKNESTKSD